VPAISSNARDLSAGFFSSRDRRSYVSPRSDGRLYSQILDDAHDAPAGHRIPQLTRGSYLNVNDARRGAAHPATEAGFARQQTPFGRLNSTTSEPAAHVVVGGWAA